MKKRILLLVFAVVSTSWTEQSRWDVYHVPTTRLTNIIWTGTKVMGIGDSGYIYTTTDTNVTDVTRSIPFTSMTDPIDIALTGGRVVTISQMGMLAYTTDGSNWEKHFNANLQYIISLENCGTYLIATCMGNGKIWESRNEGSEWTSYEANTNEWLTTTAWSGSLIVAAGSNGAVTTSPDGVTWTARTTQTTSLWWYGAAWGNGMFVIVGDRGIIATSQDGIEWTSRISGTTNPLNGVVWTGSKFVAVGTMGIVISSTNGIDWEEENSGTRATLASVICTDDNIIAAGDSGILLIAAKGIAANSTRILTDVKTKQMNITIKDKMLQIMPIEHSITKEATVWLFNMNGRLLYSGSNNIGTRGISVNLSRYNSGMCVLKAKVGTTIINEIIMLR
jgi:hypothetical protein